MTEGQDKLKKVLLDIAISLLEEGILNKEEAPVITAWPWVKRDQGEQRLFLLADWQGTKDS